MQKKIFAAALLSALLLTVGCAEDTDLSAESSVEQSTVSVTSDISAQTSSTVISLPEETTAEESSHAESSEDVISLPSSHEFVLYGKLGFCPDEGWEEIEEHVYTSADGSQTVRADLLTLPDPKGITEELLVSDALQTLPDAIVQTGAEILSLKSVVLDFLGTEHPAVSLVTKKDGKTVYQHQLYLLDGENILLLTVRAQSEDERESVLSYFENKTED